MSEDNTSTYTIYTDEKRPAFNTGGFCFLAFLIGLAATVLIWFTCFAPGTNKYPDIPELKAAETVASYDEVFTVKKGETIKVIGAHLYKPKKSEKKAPKEIFLLTFNSKGERDFVHHSVLSPEQLEEILPKLRKSDHRFGSETAIFYRKTMTLKAFNAIEDGSTVEDVEQIFISRPKMVYENGTVNCEYRHMQIFDRESGKFFVPVMKYKDGKLCERELETFYKTHMNAWLLKFLPGADWVYDHNIYNSLSSKKNFGHFNSKKTENGKGVNSGDGFFAAILALAMALVIFLVIFAVRLTVPVVPVYLVSGLFILPPVAKLARKGSSFAILMTILAFLCYYYTWLAAMPYISFWITLPALAGVGYWAVSQLLADSICEECGFMNTYVFDHEDYIGTRKEVRKEERKNYTDRQNFKYNVSELYSDGSVKNHKEDGHVDFYRNDVYNVTYEIKEYMQYYRCKRCGNIHSIPRKEEKAIDSQYLSSYESSRTHY